VVRCSMEELRQRRELVELVVRRSIGMFRSGRRAQLRRASLCLRRASLCAPGEAGEEDLRGGHRSAVEGDVAGEEQGIRGSSSRRARRSPHDAALPPRQSAAVLLPASELNGEDAPREPAQGRKRGSEQGIRGHHCAGLRASLRRRSEGRHVTDSMRSRRWPVGEQRETG
jgi:hypothetical protein